MKRSHLQLRRAMTIFLLVAGILTAEMLILMLAFPPRQKAEAPATETPLAEAPQELPEYAPDHAGIPELVDRVLGEDAANYSIYLLRPQKEKQPFLFQASTRMRAASMIKLFVLAKAMQDVKDGKLSLADTVPLRRRDMVDGAGVLAGQEPGTRYPIGKLMELMITESDNTATNILIDRVGMENVNLYLKEKGYENTRLGHKMMLANRGRMNYASAEDIGKLLTRIYNHACVDAYHDNIMIRYLVGQQDKECFPAALPDWRIAHKTGEVDQLYDDGGIFYGRTGDFILVILNDNYSGRARTIDQMKELALQIARQFVENGAHAPKQAENK